MRGIPALSGYGLKSWSNLSMRREGHRYCLAIDVIAKLVQSWGPVSGIDCTHTMLWLRHSQGLFGGN